VDEQTLARRRESWQAKDKVPRRGTLAKYAKLDSSASLAAVTDRDL